MSAVAAPLRRAPVRHDAVAGPFGLALLMHALLFAAMTLAVQWRTQPQAPIVAELWGALPPPVPVVADVVPPPPPPRPVPKPQPQPEPERPADITLEQKKPAPKQDEKKAELKKEEKKIEPKKAEAKKDEPKAEAKKVEAKKDERKAETRPPTDLERIMAQANAQAQPASGAASGATTTGASSTVRGADATYAAQVIGCIRPHIAFAVPEGTSASVYADFRVELLPDGSVASVRLVRPSGLANYDAAAERAIRRCDPFPRKPEGGIDRTIDVRMYPVEAR